MRRRPLSKSQIVCLILLWVALCYIVLTSVEEIDGFVVLSIIFSGILVFFPLYKMLKKQK